MKHRKWILIIIAALVLTGGVALFARPVLSPSHTNKTEEQTQQKATEPGFDKTLYSLKEPSSLWVVVNKQNALPTPYVPADLIVPDVRLRLGSGNEQMRLARRAEKDLQAMFSAALKDGVTLVFGSGYRSASLQRQFYTSYVTKDGQAAADTYSARPGHSEHQTGLGVDITSPSGKCHLEICWKDTPEGKWVAKHSYKYGFTIRYQKSKNKITGYQYEPWHLRYLGKALTSQVKNTTTLEEFFELPAAPDYD